MLYFWLHSPEQAKERVAQRVANGGHHIEDEVVERRYYRGLQNFFKLYIPVCDNWLLIDNTKGKSSIIAEGSSSYPTNVYKMEIWKKLNKK